MKEGTFDIKNFEEEIFLKWKENGTVDDEKVAKASINALCFLLSNYGSGNLIRLVLDTDETIREVCKKMTDELIKKNKKSGLNEK